MTHTKLLPCPFCGSTPKIRHGKLGHCQLHGDPFQDIIVKCCNHNCVASPSVKAGDIYNGGLDLARKKAVEKWNIRFNNTHVDLLEAAKDACLMINEINQTMKNHGLLSDNWLISSPRFLKIMDAIKKADISTVKQEG